MPYFEKAVAASKNVVINFTDTRQIDARFLGLILMLNKQLKKQGHQLGFTGVSSRIARIFRLNGFEFLLRPVTSELRQMLMKTGSVDQARSAQASAIYISLIVFICGRYSAIHI